MGLYLGGIILRGPANSTLQPAARQIPWGITSSFLACLLTTAKSPGPGLVMLTESCVSDLLAGIVDLRADVSSERSTIMGGHPKLLFSAGNWVSPSGCP